MPSAHGRVDTADSVYRDDRLGPRLTQRPQVGAVIDLMRWNAVWMAMPGKKQHFPPGVIALEHGSRRRAIRCIDMQRRLDGQTIEFGQACPTDNCVNRHWAILSRSVGLRAGCSALPANADFDGIQYRGTPADAYGPVLGAPAP